MNRVPFRLIFLLFLGGLLLNLLVAWVIAMVVDSDWLTQERRGHVYLSGPYPGNPSTVDPKPTAYWELKWSEGFGAIDVTSFTGQYQFAPRPELTLDEATQLIPNWAYAIEPDEVIPPSADRHESLARGWPWVTMCYDRTLGMKIISTNGRVVVSWTKVQEISWGYELSSVDWPSGMPRVIPLRPAWWGLIINTVFYAILIWVAFCSKRQLRRYRGRCTACGYELRHRYEDGCPECGWNRPQSELEVCAQL